MGDVTVIGAGVIGLTVAHELAAAGHQVRIVADRDAASSVSAVAAAIWFPHDVQVSGPVVDSSRATYQRLEQLAQDPATGVRMRTGTVLTRRPDADTAWTRAVPHHEVTPTGVRCTVPLVQTDAYLTWLRSTVLDRGVRIDTAEIHALDDVPGDFLVVAAGLRSAALLGDDTEAFPIRGQVVRLANPGLTGWTIDNDNPGGLTYIVPRAHDVVCGGTGEIGSWDERIDPDIETGILRRVCELVPALTGQPILSRAVGLRPARSAVRVEPVAGRSRPTFACYGHGGAGFTLSWGDATRIATMIGPA